MKDLFLWLSQNSIVANILLALFGIFTISIILIYIVSFFQGRELSFWPPKIGSKPITTTVTSQKQKTKNEKVEYETSEIPIKLFLTAERYDTTNDVISNFKVLYVAGINLRRMVVSNYELFKTKLLNGATLKFLLPYPQNNIISLLSERSVVHSEPSMTRNAVEMTLKNLYELSINPMNKGTIEVYFLKYIPPYSILIVNPDYEDSQLRVDLYSYKISPENCPGFWVRKKYNEDWYLFFLNEFKARLESATLINLKEKMNEKND